MRKKNRYRDARRYVQWKGMRENIQKNAPQGPGAFFFLSRFGFGRGGSTEKSPTATYLQLDSRAFCAPT